MKNTTPIKMRMNLYWKSLTLLALVGCLSVVVSNADDGVGNASKAEVGAAPEADEIDKNVQSEYVPKSDAELRRSLSRIQYSVTQKEDTEPAFRNRYWNNKKPGTYHCIVCDRELFESETKFKSGTGWPSFFQPLTKDSVGYREDRRLFLGVRTEVHCKRCDAHLGHVFDDGPQPTGKRYCMNSASLKFMPEEENAKDEATPVVSEKK